MGAIIYATKGMTLNWLGESLFDFVDAKQWLLLNERSSHDIRETLRLLWLWPNVSRTHRIMHGHRQHGELEMASHKKSL